MKRKSEVIGPSPLLFSNTRNIEVILWDNRTVEDFRFHPKPQVIRTIKSFITIPCLIEVFFTLRVYRRFKEIWSYRGSYNQVPLYSAR